MDKRITLIAGLDGAVCRGIGARCHLPQSIPYVATAINDETGHTFFLYSSPGITWDEAQACVGGLPQQSGVPAHLATITSSSENQWIVDELLLNGDRAAAGAESGLGRWIPGSWRRQNPTKAGVG